MGSRPAIWPLTFLVSSPSWKPGRGGCPAEAEEPFRVRGRTAELAAGMDCLHGKFTYPFWVCQRPQPRQREGEDAVPFQLRESEGSSFPPGPCSASPPLEAPVSMSVALLLSFPLPVPL